MTPIDNYIMVKACWFIAGINANNQIEVIEEGMNSQYIVSLDNHEVEEIKALKAANDIDGIKKFSDRALEMADSNLKALATKYGDEGKYKDVYLRLTDISARLYYL